MRNIDIINYVCNDFGVTYESLQTAKRDSLSVRPRNLCMLLIKEMNPTMSLMAIGAIFNRGHASVIHAINVCKNDMKYGFDKKTKQVYLKIISLDEEFHPTPKYYNKNNLKICLPCEYLLLHCA